jgi:hemerythrin superfamily protein
MRTITDAITEDHRELEEYYQKIVDSNDTDTQTRYQNQFTWELARHSVAEELVVYPAMEKFGSRGQGESRP